MNYRVVSALPEHIEGLLGISLAATTIFPEEDIPASLRDEMMPLTTFVQAQREGLLWVAVKQQSKEVVGFALLTLISGCIHLKELSVHPHHGRRGVGTLLLKTAIAWAKEQGILAMTLTTFSHLPWNAPFYEKLGFKIIPEGELSEQLRELWLQEAKGLDQSKRVVMFLDLGNGEKY